MPGATVTGADFMRDLTVSGESRLRIGSLFSGHGGLDLAVVSAALENWTVSALEK